MATPARPQLELRFHGRVIDHLGIQMYQSPVAAVAELIANAWDADADSVGVSLPDAITEDAELVIADNGDGMTLLECQERFLNVGFNRRGNDPRARTRRLDRPVLGRKGIGKFAGFGIAEVIVVETASRETGERTIFEMDLGRLRGEGDYVNTEPATIDVLEYDPPDDARRANHGTEIRLRALRMRQAPRADFGISMARRFLLHQRVEEFAVAVNGTPLPVDSDLEGVQYDFPGEYTAEETPQDLAIDDGWGTEPLSDGTTVRWRIAFHAEPIGDEALRGVSVFANGKLAQAPFFFLLSGGLGGQHGQQYLTGRVEADDLDRHAADLTESPARRSTSPVSGRVRGQLQGLVGQGQVADQRVVEALRARALEPDVVACP